MDGGQPMLTLRPSGLSSPAFRDWLDYVIVEDRPDVGRLYEDRHSKPELRWFWSVTVYSIPGSASSRADGAPSLSLVSVAKYRLAPKNVGLCAFFFCVFC
jgi:hypothetical protein